MKHPNSQSKSRQCSKQSAWKVKINGKGMFFIPMRSMSYSQVSDYMECRFPKYDIEIGA